MQQTIEKPVAVSGTGLHTGCSVSLTLNPAPANTGIIFRRSDLQHFEIEAQRKWVSRVVLATTLMKRGVMLSTVEHLLSAVYGSSIDNLYIDVDSLEIPILDGSAEPFVRIIVEAGITQQEAARTFLVVEDRIRVEDGDKYIEISPHEGFHISYKIDFDHPAIGKQHFEREITPEVYSSELSFARTFGFYHEVEDLLKKGLIRGGSFENAVVLGDDGVMNGELRVEDEFVRHKVLDLIGDISLCGYPLIGQVTAYKAGHALHTNLATEISKSAAPVSRVGEEELLDLVEVVNQ